MLISAGGDVADNWFIDKSFVGPFKMTFDSTKGGKFSNAIINNVVKANQTNESFVCRWQHAHATLTM